MNEDSANNLNKLLDSARDLHGKGKTFGAVDLLEKSDEFIDSPRVSALLAHYYYLLRHYESSGAAARKALESNPVNKLALYTMGELSMKSRNLDDAEMYFREVLAAGSLSAHPYIRLADIFCSRQDFDGAIEILQQSLENHTGHADLLEKLHYSLTMAGRIKEAQQIRKTRVQAQDNDSADIKNLLNRFENLESFKAIEQLKILASMKHYQSEPLIHDRMAYYLTREGNYAEAISYLETLVRLQPRNDNAVLRLAEALALSNNPEKAKTILEPIARYRNDMRVKLIKLQLDIASGELQTAMKVCVELLRDSPRNKKLRQILKDLSRAGIRPKT